MREYVARTGLDVLKGADILKKAPEMYTSNVEYASNPIAQSLRDAARVHLADLGTRIIYTQHGGYDTHANEVPNHPRLLTELSGAIMDFFQDIRDHNASDNVVMLVFTESAGASGTMAAAATMEPGAARSSSETGEGRPVRRVPFSRHRQADGRRHGAHLRLPRIVHHAPGTVDGRRGRSNVGGHYEELPIFAESISA